VARSVRNPLAGAAATNGNPKAAMSVISPSGSAIRISSPFRRATSSYSYPLPAVFWTIFEVFLFVIWFWILTWVFIDIFHSPDLSGLARALWFLFVLFIPLVGVLLYLIAPRREHARAGRAVSPRQDEAFRSQVRETASASPVG